MLRQENLRERKREVEAALKDIENAQADSFRALLKMSRLTQEGFVNATLELPQDEQEELIEAMFRDETLFLILHDKPQNWRFFSDELKAEILKKVYDKIHIESKPVHNAMIVSSKKQQDHGKYIRMHLRTLILDLSETRIPTEHGQRTYYEAAVAVSGGTGLIGIGFCEPYNDRGCKQCEEHNVDYCRCCSIRKSIKSARNDLFYLPLSRTLPCKIIGKTRDTEIHMFPAKPNTGIVAAEKSVCVLLAYAGLKDVNTKLIGDRSRTSVLKAVKKGVKKIPNAYCVKKRPRNGLLGWVLLRSLKKGPPFSNKT